MPESSKQKRLREDREKKEKRVAAAKAQEQKKAMLVRHDNKAAVSSKRGSGPQLKPGKYELTARESQSFVEREIESKARHPDGRKRTDLDAVMLPVRLPKSQELRRFNLASIRNAAHNVKTLANDIELRTHGVSGVIEALTNIDVLDGRVAALRKTLTGTR